MEFHPRPQAFAGHELAELVAISPDDAAMKLVRSMPAATSICDEPITFVALFTHFATLQQYLMQHSCLACMQHFKHAMLTGQASCILLLCCATGIPVAGP
jgi:hypothetical protein